MSRSALLSTDVVEFDPGELIVTAGAGIAMMELAGVLAARGQRLRIPSLGTLGGAVSTRRNLPTAKPNAAMPNTVLALGVIDGEGRRFKVGGPTVKNVSGFDLVKLIVGSRGALVTIEEITMRTEPIPPCSRWFVGRGSADALFEPSAVCRIPHEPTEEPTFDEVLVNLEGHPDDVDDQAGLLEGFREVPRPTDGELLELTRSAAQQAAPDPAILQVCRRLKAAFDPENKLSPMISIEWGLV